MPDSSADQDTHFMRMALALAACATAVGEVPIAAVLVQGTEVLASSHNFRESWQDPTAHAELIIIREAAKRSGTWRLLDTTLYVTVEPCPMCLGAVILARIPRVVYGARDAKGGACGSVLDFTDNPRLNHHVAVTGRVLEEESQALLQEFFRGLRSAG
ncbi:MAG: tRNA adenosine(34) deaminase TadA [Nitrospira sp.]|nr:tRNA adenosine(34) deaminase TadA [Nitrospira sp.]